MKRRKFLRSAALAAPVMTIPLMFRGSDAGASIDVTYEQGTMTPTIHGFGEYEQVSGYYQRIGDTVYFNAMLKLK